MENTNVSEAPKAAKAVKKNKGPKKPNVVIQFFKDLIAESKKVVWPGKKQVVNNTGVVLAVCVLSGAALFVVDMVLGLLLRLITG